MGKGGHAAIEGEGVQPCLGVVVGDETVEEAWADGGGEGVETGAGVLLGDAVVVLGSDVGLAHHLVGREYLGVLGYVGAELLDAEGGETGG